MDRATGSAYLGAELLRSNQLGARNKAVANSGTSSLVELHISSEHWGTDFLSLAATERFSRYFEAKLQSSRAPLELRFGMPLLLTLLQRRDREDDFDVDNMKCVVLRLEIGSSPNKVWESYTIWQYWLHFIHSKEPPSPSLYLASQVSLYRKCRCFFLSPQEVLELRAGLKIVPAQMG